MKKIYCLVSVLFLSSAGAFAQLAPGVEWEQCIPNASVTSIVTVSDSIFTVLYDRFDCSDSTSVGLRSYDSQGNLLWEKIFTPPTASSYHSFCLTKNNTNGYFITGSWIKPGSTNHWIVVTDSEGNMLLTKTLYFDSVAAPHFSKAIADSLNGFLFAGETYTQNLRDLYIVRFSESGDILSEKILGGSLFDYMGDVIATDDYGYFLAAYTTSNDLDVTGNHGAKDIWLLKFDGTGALQWSKCYGDTMNEEAHSVIALPDGYLVAGMSQSNLGTVDDHHGTTDYYDDWIFKIDTVGNMMWNQSLGGTRGDFVTQMVRAGDSSVVLTGSSYSVNGNISDHHSNTIYDDQWTLKMNINSSLMWTKSTGGSLDDWAHCIAVLDSTQMIVGGASISNDGDHHSVCFTNDCGVISGGWIVKLNEACSNFPKSQFTLLQDGKEAEFTNQSYNANNYLWNFGDGTSSIEQSPTHIYSYNGIFTACLKALYDSCSENISCVTISTCTQPASAHFNVQYPGGLMVEFNATANNSAEWFWDFGDGGTDTLQNPSHLYTANGPYTVTLIVADSCDNKDTLVKSINTCNGFIANFSSINNYNEVSFSDLSQGFPESWSWFFGDGSTSSEQNPIHIYSAAGIYPVCLIASNSICPEDTFCSLVDVECPPFQAAFLTVSDFNFVQFNDESEIATSWSWDFGDGGFSNEQNPSHTYQGAGTYHVCLSVQDGCSADTICEEVDIVCSIFSANFSFIQEAKTATFQDQSVNAIQWAWDFGDGLTSTEQNPVHVYENTGTYTVCLIAYNGCSSDTLCEEMEIVCPTFSAGFSFILSADTASFQDQSLNAIQWHWNFDDGFTSTEQNPTHIYPATGGTFNVCLVVYDGCSYDTTCDTVNVYPLLSGQANENIFSFKIYPNPAHDLATIEIWLKAAEKIKLILYDVSGKVIEEVANNIMASGIHNLSWNTSSLTPGAYWLEMRGEKTYAIQKVLIQ